MFLLWYTIFLLLLLRIKEVGIPEVQYFMLSLQCTSTLPKKMCTISKDQFHCCLSIKYVNVCSQPMAMICILLYVRFLFTDRKFIHVGNHTLILLRMSNCWDTRNRKKSIHIFWFIAIKHDYEVQFG